MDLSGVDAAVDISLLPGGPTQGNCAEANEAVQRAAQASSKVPGQSEQSCQHAAALYLLLIIAQRLADLRTSDDVRTGSQRCCALNASMTAADDWQFCHNSVMPFAAHR
jgi:hypothetical protein